MLVLFNYQVVPEKDYHRMVLPHPTVDCLLLTGLDDIYQEPTSSLDPENVGLLPQLTERHPIEKPGAGILLMLLTCFVVVLGTVRSRKPSENLLDCNK